MMMNIVDINWRNIFCVSKIPGIVMQAISKAVIVIAIFLGLCNATIITIMKIKAELRSVDENILHNFTARLISANDTILDISQLV